MRAALAVLLLAACSVDDVYECALDEQCVRGGTAGRCEPLGACSFADSLCTSGWRYAALAPAEVAEQCVGEQTPLVDGPAHDAGAIDADAIDAAAHDASPAPDALPPPDAGPTPDGAIVELVFPVVADTMLKLATPTTSYGDAAVLRAEAGAVILFRFDVGAVGAREVSAVFLHVTTTPAGGLNRGSVEIFRLLESWSEAAASWRDRLAGTAWSDAGAQTPGSRDGTILGSAEPIADDVEHVIALPGALVEFWARDTASNHGVVLQTRDQGNRMLELVSREGTPGKAAFLRVRLAP